jgi:acyl-CoA synthetase (AMP-forming)/AMP-acid ligase II
MIVNLPSPYIEPMIGSLWELIDRQAAIAPNAAATLAPGRRELTYETLRRNTLETAAWLNGHGIRNNDRLAIVLPDGPEAAVAFISLSASATCAPLNPNCSSSEFDFYLRDLRPRALVVSADSKSPAIAPARKAGVPVLELILDQQLPAGSFTLSGDLPLGRDDGRLAQPNDVALLLYTSGTSARPKLAPLTHRNLAFTAHQICDAVQLVRADRCLNVMPLFHIHGLSMLYASLAAGASMVCASGFSGKNFFPWLREFSPTWYSAAPAFHQIILQYAQRFPADAANAQLRFLRSASAPMLPRTIAERETIFRAPFIEAYGMTEAGPQIASNRLPPYARKPGRASGGARDRYSQ